MDRRGLLKLAAALMAGTALGRALPTSAATPPPSTTASAPAEPIRMMAWDFGRSDDFTAGVAYTIDPNRHRHDIQIHQPGPSATLDHAGLRYANGMWWGSAPKVHD